MTVAELIAALQKFPQDLPVVVQDDVDARSILEVTKERMYSTGVHWGISWWKDEEPPGTTDVVMIA